MKGFIVDTDTWIEFFHQRSGVGVHILQTPKNEIYASEVSIAELTYGAVNSQNVEKHLREPQIIKENFQVLPTKHFSRIPGIHCVDWVNG